MCPRATSRTDETFKKELDTCPGGFVTLRKMTYGEYLHRRQIMSKFMAPMNKKGAPTSLEYDYAAQKVRVYEFQKSIVDHNLEDDKRRKLDLTLEDDIASLDPVIAQEIEEHIDELNQELTEDEAKNSRRDSGTTQRKSQKRK